MKRIIAGILSLSLVSCAVVHGKSSTEEYVSDTGITTQIKSKYLASDLVSAPEIHVETLNGVVQLSGFVSNYAQVREAQTLAQSVNGVKRVESNLIVGTPNKHRARN